MKEGYKKNRKRVFEIYGKKRGREWDTHHIEHKKDGGSNRKGNLFPVPKPIHRMFHKKGTKNKDINKEMRRRYGEDPYL